MEKWCTGMASSFSEPAAPAANEDREAFSRKAFSRLLLVVTFLLIFLMAARTPLDTDLWWHLRSGEETLRTGRPLLQDMFSVTRMDTEWTNVYWLPDAFMAWLFSWSSYLGLSAFVTALAVGSMAITYLQSEGPPLLKSAALLLGSVVASTVWSPRPQTVSLLLFALVAYLLYRYKWKLAANGRQNDYLWALPVIFLLWGNTHGGFPMGFLLIAAVIGGELLNYLFAIPTPCPLPPRKLLRLGLWTALSALAVIVNPNGIDVWLLSTKTVGMNVIQTLIPEWASPDFHVLVQQSMAWLLLAVIAAIALSGRVIDGGDLLAVLGFAYMALLSGRFFGPFALVAVPVLTRYGSAALARAQAHAPLNRLFANRKPPEPDSTAARRFKKAVNLLLVALLAFAAFAKLYIVTHPALVNSYLRQGYPVAAVEWLEDNRPGARLFNEYNWGGYLQWQARSAQIFIDGRTDLYGDALILAWMDALNAKPGWENLLDRYSVDIILLAPDRPLLGELSQAGWELLYEDDQAVIYGREPQTLR